MPYVFCIRFTYKEFYLSLALGYSYLRDSKRQKLLGVVQWLITAIKVNHFVWRYCHVIILLKCTYYYAFQRHANSEVQKPTCVCVSSLPSIILAFLLRNSSLLQQVQNFMVCDWWISIRFCEFLCIKVPCLGTTHGPKSHANPTKNCPTL